MAAVAMDPGRGRTAETLNRDRFTKAIPAAITTDMTDTGPERALRERLASNPEDFQAILELGRVLLRAGRQPEAMAAFDRAAELVPGHAAPFTMKAIASLRSRFGQPPPAKAASQNMQVVSMQSLGSNGRFGNQILQYGFLRLYADAFGLCAETPDWIGRDLFGCDDPYCSRILPAIDETQADFFASLNRRSPVIHADRDLIGYFCRHTSEWRDHKHGFQALFQPAPHLAVMLDDAMKMLRARGRTLVAVHVRRGDFGSGHFWPAPVRWYLDWLKALWPTLTAPVLYVASDDPGVAAQFADYAPLDAAALGQAFPGAEFYLDHYILSRADHLAISNSTFSFTAAMLNQSATVFMRPDPQARAMTSFDPWNADIFLNPVIDAKDYGPDDHAIISQWIQPDDTVVHIGQFCAPWTNLIRARYPGLRVIELESQGLDQERSRLKHVNHLIVSPEQDLDAVLAQSMGLLTRSRVDVVHFRVPDAAAMMRLAHLGYGFYALRGGDLVPVAPDAMAGARLAIHKRLVTTAGTGGLDLVALCAQFGIAVRGVIHIGAHEGEELATYRRLSAEKVLFVEANPAVFARLEAAMKNEPGVTVVQRAICDRGGTADLHLASFDQSSSLFVLHKHRDIYPQIVPAGRVSVETATLDALMTELNLPPENFNLLAIDVQGAEALVLKGAGQTLSGIDAVSVEVNFAELYRGTAQIEDIDDLLGAAGFTRVATVSPFHFSWGDAFYVRVEPGRALL